MKIDDLNVMGIISDQKVISVTYTAIPTERSKECNIFPVSNTLCLRLKNYDPMHYGWINRV
jgi:hypothetical protein